VTSSNGSHEASNARLVATAWENSKARNSNGELLTTVRGVDIRIGHIEYGSDDNAEWIDIWLGPKFGNPAIRAVNPEVLVPDMNGDVEQEVLVGPGVTRTVRYRTDPVVAIAELIASVRGV
jgi:hypothetical protein